MTRHDDNIERQQPQGVYKYPHVNMFAICNRVIDDPVTGTVSLLDLYEDVTASKFPAMLERLAIYLKLSDGEGRYTCKIKCLYLNAESPTGTEDRGITGQDEQEIEFTNDKTTHHGVFYFAPIVFPKPGRYEFWLLVDGKYVEYRGINVKSKGKP